MRARAMKRVIRLMLGFKLFRVVQRTFAVIEAMHMIKMG